MTEDERLNAVIEGHLNGTWFRIAERLDLPWKIVRNFSYREISHLLRNKR